MDNGEGAYCATCDSVVTVACGQYYCSRKPKETKMTRQEAFETKISEELARLWIKSKELGYIIYQEPKETKMTRQEAIKKIAGSEYGAVFIDNLEALGLLKFEEEKNDMVYNLWAANPRWSAFKAALEQNGYKIVRNT